MPNGHINIYEVYDGEKLIERGTGKYIAERFNISRNSIEPSISKKNKIHGIYENKKVGFVSQKYERTNKQIIDYLYRHLSEYGNTCLNDNPEPYLKRLEEMLNRKIKVRTAWDKGDPYNFEPEMGEPHKYKRGKITYYYILELA